VGTRTVAGSRPAQRYAHSSAAAMMILGAGAVRPGRVGSRPDACVRADGTARHDFSGADEPAHAPAEHSLESDRDGPAECDRQRDEKHATWKQGFLAGLSRQRLPAAMTRRLATVTATSQPLRREGARCGIHVSNSRQSRTANRRLVLRGNSRCLLTAIPRERPASAPITELPSDCPAASVAYRRFPLPAATGLPGGGAPERLTGGGPPPAAANVVAAAVAIRTYDVGAQAGCDDTMEQPVQC
jgi:hypothetical protein